MATLITKQVIENGNRNYIAVFTINSDGSAKTDSAALDPTSSGDMGVTIAGATYYPNTHLKLWELRYNLPPGLNVRLVWEATSAQDAWDLAGYDVQKFFRQGGLYVPQSNGAAIAGATGKLDLIVQAYTIPNSASNAFGTVQIWAKKDFNQQDPSPFVGHAMLTGVSATAVARAVTTTG